VPLKPEELPIELLKESNKLHDRNLEIHNFVEFLCSKNRMLKIYGKKKSGRKAITRHSIKTVMSSNRSPFIDGVFWVDLKKVGTSSVINEINQ
jgi:hypothetical protein